MEMSENNIDDRCELQIFQVTFKLFYFVAKIFFLFFPLTKPSLTAKAIIERFAISKSPVQMRLSFRRVLRNPFTFL